MVELTKAQQNVLAVLRSIPNSKRIGGETIPFKILECYDGRTVNSLLQKGYIKFTSRGVVVIK